MTTAQKDQKAEMNCENRTVFYGVDNLDALRGLNRGIADAIITDPPFCSNQFYEHCFGTDTKDKKGKTKPGFDDAWTLDDVKKEEHKLIHDKHPEIYHICALARQTHTAGMQAYLIMMATRILLCHEILKETGSMYLHCDHHANSYLRLLMDIIFGEENFRNQIIWRRSHRSDGKHFGNVADHILFYSKTDNYTWNDQFIPQEMKESRHDLTGERTSTGESGEPWRGYDPGKIGRHWAVPLTGRFAQWVDEFRIPGYCQIEGIHDRLEALDKAGLIHWSRNNTPSVIHPAESKLGQKINCVITDVPFVRGIENADFRTQKPVKLYARFVLASTNPGDLVIDPFCGCATTIVAAENNGRQWIGIDRDPVALDMVYQQLGKLNENSGDFWRKKGNIMPRKRPAKRTDQGDVPHYRSHFKTLYEFQERKCAGCDYPKAPHGLEVDHDVPKSKGGGDEIENLNLLCPRCNRRKGTGTLAQLRAKLKRECLMYHQQEEGYVLPTRQKIKKPRRISKKQTSMKLK